VGGHALGVDVGGTKVAAGVVAADGTVTERVRLDTPAEDGDATAQAVADAVEAVGSAGDGLPIGVGAAGMVDRSGMVRYSPNLPWKDFPLRRYLHTRFERPVVVENDANAAAWAEFRVGAAQEARTTALMLTVGTGIGGGLVIDDRLVRGANGLGAEFGHLIVAEGARRCPCGNHGCLEAMASGTAIGRTAEEWRRDGRIPAASLLADVPHLTGVAVGRAAAEGDETAIAAVAECGRWLGIGIASLVNAIDPEVVVVGGGASALSDLLLAPAREAFAERAIGASYRSLPPVVATALADDGGLVGSALLAMGVRSATPRAEESLA
jgi:glucokinase